MNTKKCFLVTLSFIALLALTGCVSQSKYDSLLATCNSLELSYRELSEIHSELEKENNLLKVEYSKLSVERELLNGKLVEEYKNNGKLTKEVDRLGTENEVLMELLDDALILLDDGDTYEAIDSDKLQEVLIKSGIFEESTVDSDTSTANDNTGSVQIGNIRPNGSIDASDDYKLAKEKIRQGYEKTKKAATEIGADVTRDVIDAFVTGDQESAEELRKNIKKEFSDMSKNIKKLFEDNMGDSKR